MAEYGHKMTYHIDDRTVNNNFNDEVYFVQN